MFMFEGLRPMLMEEAGLGGDGGGGSMAANASLDSAVDSLLSSGSGGASSSDGGSTPATDAASASAPALAPGTGEQATSAGAAPPSPEDPKLPGEETKPEGADAQQAAQTAEGVEDPEDDTDLDQGMEAADKPNFLDLKQPRGQRIYRSYKAYKAISDALGHEPSVEDVRSHFEAFSDKAAMEDEFMSGDPTKATNFFHYWNTLDGTGQAMGQALAPLADYLAANNQQAYVSMAMPVINRFVNALYEKAAAESNPDLKKGYMYAARMADHHVRGDWRREDGAQPTAGQQPANPQLAEREAAVNQRFNQIQAYEQQQQQAIAGQWVNSVQSANNSALDTAIETALSPLKATLPARVFAATKRDFTEAVNEHLAKDADAQRMYNIRLNQSLRSRTEQDRETLKGQYMQRASRAVRALAPGFLKEAGVAATAKNAQQHQQLAAAAASGKAPNSAGQPVTQTKVVDERQFGNKGDLFDAKLEALLRG